MLPETVLYAKLICSPYWQMQIHGNMEESTVPAPFMKAKMKETSNSNQDCNSNEYIDNGDATLVGKATDHRSTMSLTDDEENSGFIDKEFSVGVFSDMEGSSQANVSVGENEALPLPTRLDQAAQDLQAQEDELRGLGINVVDQLSLERNVEAAVS